jgi:hypothetical protein
MDISDLGLSTLFEGQVSRKSTTATELKKAIDYFQQAIEKDSSELPNPTRVTTRAAQMPKQLYPRPKP